jgi:hypothetical protein
MTTNNDIRLRDDMRVFKSVNRDQQRQNRVDKLRHIQSLVKEYNDNLLEGEKLITFKEMEDQLSRKV